MILMKLIEKPLPKEISTQNISQDISTKHSQKSQQILKRNLRKQKKSEEKSLPNNTQRKYLYLRTGTWNERARGFQAFGLPFCCLPFPLFLEVPSCSGQFERKIQDLE